MSKGARMSAGTAAEPVKPQPPGALADPVVRIMAYIALGLVILFLASVVSVLGTGITQRSGPRSAAERDLMSASASIQAGAKGQAWAPYVDALIGSGDLSAARVALAQARASVAGTIAPLHALDLSEARLDSAEKRWVEAVNAADQAMKGYTADRDARKAKAAKEGSATTSISYNPSFYDAVLVKAKAEVQLKRWKDALALYDLYLIKDPTAADILIDRGTAKIELNDKTGAEKDFRSALKFVPYDEEAKAGLKRIGVAQ